MACAAFLTMGLSFQHEAGKGHISHETTSPARGLRVLRRRCLEGRRACVSRLPDRSLSSPHSGLLHSGTHLPVYHTLLLHDNCVLARRHSFSLAFPVCFHQTQVNDSSGMGPAHRNASSASSIGRRVGDQRDEQENDQRYPVLVRALTAILPSGKALRPKVCEVAPFYREEMPSNSSKNTPMKHVKGIRYDCTRYPENTIDHGRI